MLSNKKKYDLIVSLGGNCAAAHNLRYRKMRQFSLPFDWLYIIDERPIKYLTEGFKDNFKNFCLEENLKKLSPEEEKTTTGHNDTYHYFDTYTQYRFVNHFHKSIEDGGYKAVKDKLDRRMKRLYEQINNAQNILLLLSTSFEMNTDCIYKLKQCLENQWKNKTFDFEVIQFACKENNIKKDNQITIRKNTRSINDYDFYNTNFEWAFLDDISLAKKVHNGVKININLGFVKYRLTIVKKQKEEH